MADTLEEIRKHVEEVIRRLSEAESQPAPQRPSAESLGEGALSELAANVNILGVKVDQAGNLLAQVTDLLESQAERLETLEMQVGDPEPLWQTPLPALEPEAEPEPAPARDLELATIVSGLLESVRAEVGVLAVELRERAHGLDMRISDIYGRFEEMHELTWQHRNEMRHIEERLLMIAEASMAEASMAEAAPADELQKLAIKAPPAVRDVQPVASAASIASPSIIEAVEGVGGLVSSGVWLTGAPMMVPAFESEPVEDEAYPDPIASLAPMDARTARRLEELVEREVRLQQQFAPGATSKRGRRGRPSVMVVDDLSDARKILSIYLSRTGYQVVTASSAEDCLAKLRHHEVDAVVLDASMPGGGGAQVCRSLREDSMYAAKRDLPVIIYTAYPDEHPSSVVEAWGATDYVVKGGDMLPLITALVRHTQEEPEAVL